MPSPKHTKESLVLLLQNIAHNLGTNKLTKKDISKHIGTSVLNYHFGSLRNACTEAGLHCAISGANLPEISKQNIISDTDLFLSILDIETNIGHPPGHNEYSSFGRYSTKPFKKRYSSWKNTLIAYERWKSQNDIQPANPQKNQSELTNNTPPAINNKPTQSYHKLNSSPLHLYGEPIDFRGLRHAPTNEQGVVYLFGMVSRELGFSIESIQQGSPDCEGKYLHDDKKGLWAKARIEFEYKSSNFKEHGHDESACNFIVCWIHDWKECPIKVIELKSEIIRLTFK
jgi:hypothetical protein